MRKYSASWRIIKSELSGRFLFGAKHFDISGQTGIQAPGPDSSQETEKSKEVLREEFKLNTTNNTLSVLGLAHLIKISFGPIHKQHLARMLKSTNR